MKNSSNFIVAVIGVICGTVGFPPAQSADSAANVVLIMTDNHGAWTLGCYGNGDIRSPNIDRLAAEGTLFTRSFASNPVCSPTRATVLTGLIPSQHGVHSFLSGGRLQVGPNARSTLDQFTSLPEILKRAGYACGLVGKWHLGDNLHPQEGLEDYWITMPHGGTSTFYDAPVIQHAKIRKEPKYLTDLWTEHAVKFVDQQANKDQPFFLFLSYNGPYALGRLLLKDGRNRHAAYYADKDILSFPRQKPHPWQLNNRDYINNPVSIRRVATEVSGVDDGVGTVMKTLKDRGIDDDTVVIFLADQGWVGGHGGFFGMGDHTRPLTARDGMMLIPTIWRHPNKIAAGKRSSHMIANYDLMPTLLGYLGLNEKMPQQPPSPGTDYSAVLRDQAAKLDAAKPIFYEFENLRSIRTERFKYVHRHPNGPHELYDLPSDPDEFNNLVDQRDWRKVREDLHGKLTSFYGQYADPKYDMWHGGTSQVRIHDGIDEEIAQLTAADPPDLPAGFEAAELRAPEGFTVELAAGPPLVSHPTLGCFDDSGHLYVCNNTGVNLSKEELEKQLPNSIHRLTDSDGDGRYDSSTVFADKMTFPMGGAWHQGSLYVASPPNIWKLTDTDDDGIADLREAIVEHFGYTGNAASIHGCFLGADGRLYWCDGYHGHEFTDDQGNVTSKREGSYLFSCLPDGSDVQILCGGGMDNPVELDLTDQGDVLGTVNILYTRPRVDCLVHWLHGGAYPHRQRVLKELFVTGDLLGPAHRFGHVAVSGMTRYRSGAIDHRWKDDLFATFFNRGKVVRLEMQRDGSTWSATEHEFLSSPNREFHPTDVIEDADGSLLVVDTGGWFYRGCPTSQFAKPELLGAIYRIRRNGMTPLVDPRGQSINWSSLSNLQLMKLLNDTRFAVRQRAITECASRGESILPNLKTMVARADIRVRRNCLWVLSRLGQQTATAQQATESILLARNDRIASIRQLAARCLGQCAHEFDAALLAGLLKDSDAGVRRAAATTIGKQGKAKDVPLLMEALTRAADRAEHHAIVYAMLEIDSPQSIYEAANATPPARSPNHDRKIAAMLTLLDQMKPELLRADEVVPLLESEYDELRKAALHVTQNHPDFNGTVSQSLRRWLGQPDELHRDVAGPLLARLADDEVVAAAIGKLLAEDKPETKRWVLRKLAAAAVGRVHPSWIEPLRAQLLASDHDGVVTALRIVASANPDPFKDQLQAIAADPATRPLLRLRALQAFQKSPQAAPPPLFDLAMKILASATNPSDAIEAARWLSSAKLSGEQRTRVADALNSASPMQLRELIKCFDRLQDVTIAKQFLSNIGSAEAFLTLPETELSDVIKRFPRETLPAANRLLDKLKQHEQQKRDRLNELLAKLTKGGVDRGREVFFSEKAKCSDCHRVAGKGKQIGPELTTIGANRSTSDLLESIVLPSSSIVRDYETFNVLTMDGRALSGLIAAETADELTLQLSTGQQVTVAHRDVEQISPNTVSIMPNGLEQALSEGDLADLIAFLKSLK